MELLFLSFKIVSNGTYDIQIDFEFPSFIPIPHLNGALIHLFTVNLFFLLSALHTKSIICSRVQHCVF